MKKREIIKKLKIAAFILSLIVLTITTQNASAADSSLWTANGSVKNVIIVSWDGAQRNHTLNLLNQGKLTNLAGIKSDGAMTDVYFPPFIKVSGGNIDFVTNKQAQIADTIYWEQAVTDLGHARMLTGKWGYENRICDAMPDDSTINPFDIDYLCTNSHLTVPKGETIMEKIKKQDRASGKNEFKIGVTASRRSNMADMIKSYPSTSLKAKFSGWGDDNVSILMSNKGSQTLIGHGFYSTTFLNASSDLDLFFDPSSVNQYNQNDAHAAVFDESNRYVFGTELKDSAVAAKAINFIADANKQGKRFFLFVHFCEPDLFGHAYGENSTAYSRAIVSNDKALGNIVNKLKQLNIYNDTLLIVTADHGAQDNSTEATFNYKDGEKWLTFQGPLHGQVNADNHLVWMANNEFAPSDKTLLQPQITQLTLEALGLTADKVSAPAQWDTQAANTDLSTALEQLTLYHHNNIAGKKISTNSQTSIKTQTKQLSQTNQQNNSHIATNDEEKTPFSAGTKIFPRLCLFTKSTGFIIFGLGILLIARTIIKIRKKIWTIL